MALARALVIEPRVLLCDEPLGALDRKLRQQMQFELKELQKRLGVTLVFVTHDQEEALAMSDRIAVMNGGRVEQVGAPTEIYERPRTRFVADFIGEINLLEGGAHPRALRPEKIRFVPAADARPDGHRRDGELRGRRYALSRAGRRPDLFGGARPMPASVARARPAIRSAWPGAIRTP